ncbi:MAG: flippase-like domain-containing protein [Candidatus Delongbacteria bacterium]|nr:flippase-like domain-containing protein [Candidatus Delongbacteria bacterium]
MNLLRNKIFIRITKLTLLVIVLFFVVKNIIDNFSNIKEINISDLNYGFILPALIVSVISMFIPVFAWKYLLGTLGSDLKLSKAVRIWFISNLGRYIPGKVWQISGLIVLSNKEGVAKKVSSTSVIYSQIVANLTGLFLGSLLMSQDHNNPEYYAYPWFAYNIIGIAVILMVLPYFINNFIDYALKLLKKPKNEFKIGYLNFSIYTSMQFMNWLIMGLSFVIFVNIFTELSVIQHPVSLFILPISWTAGLLAIFAPGGIGVREGIMTFYLLMFIDPAYAAVIPWIYRIWLTFFEMLLAGVFYFAEK